MLPEELRGLLQQRPFIPFRIHLDDNRVFEVRQPDLVLLGRRVAVLGVPEAGAAPPLHRAPRDHQPPARRPTGAPYLDRRG